VPIAASLLPEFDHEMTTTRSLLERIPDAEAAWKPHPKSWSLGDLAAHVVNLLTWAPPIFERTELDLNPPGGPGFTPARFTSTADLLVTFDANAARARAAVAAQPDEAFLVTWSLLNAGSVVLALPRIACWRSFIMNHQIHHRGQLSVYLRLRDVPLPSIYGPTADTQ